MIATSRKRHGFIHRGQCLPDHADAHVRLQRQVLLRQPYFRRGKPDIVAQELTTGQDGIPPLFDDGVPDPYTVPISGGYSLISIPTAYLMLYDDWEIALGFSTGYTFRTPVGDLGIGGASRLRRRDARLR